MNKLVFAIERTSLAAESEGECHYEVVGVWDVDRRAKLLGSGVGDAKISEVNGRISVGLDNVATGRILLSAHLRRKLQQVMTRVRPEDLSVAEIVALLDILTPADSRVVGGPANRP
jgi:hypothetical protein